MTMFSIDLSRQSHLQRKRKQLESMWWSMMGIGSPRVPRKRVRSFASVACIAAVFAFVQSAYAAPGTPLAAPAVATLPAVPAAAAPAVDPAAVAAAATEPVTADASQTVANTTATLATAAATVVPTPSIPSPAVPPAQPVVRHATHVVRTIVAPATSSLPKPTQLAPATPVLATVQHVGDAASDSVATAKAVVSAAPIVLQRPIVAVTVPMTVRPTLSGVHHAATAHSVAPRVRRVATQAPRVQVALAKPSLPNLAAPLLRDLQATPSSTTAPHATGTSIAPRRVPSPSAPSSMLGSAAATSGAGGGSLFIALLVSLFALAVPGMLPPLRLPRRRAHEHIPILSLERPD
jgi:hypothetical protein